MAYQWNCDGQCGLQAIMTWTNLEDGEVQAYCANCLAHTCAAVAEGAGVLDDFLTRKLTELQMAGVIKPAPEPRKGKAAPEPEAPADAVDVVQADADADAAGAVA